MMYKLQTLITSVNNIVGKQCVLRISDNTSIPFDPDNSDYAEYLKWVADGNTPLPAEEQA